MTEIRVFESFAGYGSQLMALRRLERAHPDKIKVVPVGISEIDPHAIKAYHAVHGEDVPNFGDISKIDWAQVPDFDLFTMSSPCQDFSSAGLQRGGRKAAVHVPRFFGSVERLSLPNAQNTFYLKMFPLLSVQSLSSNSTSGRENSKPTATATSPKSSTQRITAYRKTASGFLWCRYSMAHGTTSLSRYR